MKKFVLMAAFAAFASAGVAAAQQPGPPPGGRAPGGRGGPGGGMMMDRMLLRGITLTDAQQTQLKALHDADQQKMQAERANGGGRQEMEAIRAAREKGDTATAKQLMDAQRVKMDARRDEQVAAIRGILSSDQMAAFDANVAEMKKREAEGGGRGGFGGRGGRGPRPPQG
jgi:Spy/CpxP family protein refolding chaperone